VTVHRSAGDFLRLADQAHFDPDVSPPQDMKPNVPFQFGPGRTSTPRVGMMPMLKPHPNTH
jgi:hypothetical protein